MRYFAGCVWLEGVEGDWLADDGVELGDPLVDGRVEPLALVVLLVPSPLEALLGVVLAPRSELPVIGDLLLGAEADDGLAAFAALEPFWHCCCAACVFGPLMPSIAPGSQPCAFSCCCSCLIESLPALDLLGA